MTRWIGMVVAVGCTAIVLLLAFVIFGGGRSRPRRQFTLRTLLGIVLLANIWFSLIPCIDLVDRKPWHAALLAGGIWLVFFVVYLKLRLVAVAVSHCSGFLFFGMFIAVAVIRGGHITVEDLRWLGLVAAIVGSLVSFPVSILAILGFGSGGKAQRGQHE